MPLDGSCLPRNSGAAAPIFVFLLLCFLLLTFCQCCLLFTIVVLLGNFWVVIFSYQVNFQLDGSCLPQAFTIFVGFFAVFFATYFLSSFFWGVLLGCFCLTR